MNSDQQYLNLYFQVHQPRRLRKFQFFVVGLNRNYFDDDLNENIIARIASQCYLPANKMLLKLIRKFPQLRITFSISGSAMEQFEQYTPVVLKSFRALAETGAVEFLAETYYHSLSYFANEDEFIEQIALHSKKLHQLLGVTPTIFRNTELIYSNGIGKIISDLGFSGMFIDGIEEALNGKTPNALYQHPDENLVLFPRNFRLSDDIAFRYSDSCWSEWPLTGEKFIQWLNAIPKHEKFVGLAMDYETFGEHKKVSSGIFDFLNQVIVSLLKENKFKFVTPSEAIRLISVEQSITTERVISWADTARDLSAWLGNPMQRDAFNSLHKLHYDIINSDDEELIATYRHLQTSDHFYYMCTRKDDDGAIHQYFSPYSSPYEAFMTYMNVVTDLELRVGKQGAENGFTGGRSVGKAIRNSILHPPATIG